MTAACAGAEGRWKLELIESFNPQWVALAVRTAERGSWLHSGDELCDDCYDLRRVFGLLGGGRLRLIGLGPGACRSPGDSGHHSSSDIDADQPSNCRCERLN